MKGKKPEPIEVRFWRLVDVRDENECWEFTGYRNPDSGYGQVSIAKPDRERFGGRTATAPVVACTLVHGPRPDGQIVLHSCDHAPCCNPNHLRWGTYLQNSQDAWERGRQRGGQYHPGAKVTDGEVEQIIDAWHHGVTIQVLAEAYDLSESRVSVLVKGATGRGAAAYDRMIAEAFA